VKLIPKVSGDRESTHTGGSQNGKPEAICMERKIQLPTLKHRKLLPVVMKG
jgi:hypothetical protein